MYSSKDVLQMHFTISDHFIFQRTPCPKLVSFLTWDSFHVDDKNELSKNGTLNSCLNPNIQNER